jgi:NitT/TauT family transport system permease protein
MSAAGQILVDPAEARSAGRLSRGSVVAIPPLLAFVALLGLWELWVTVFDVKEFVVPAPSGIAQELVRNFPLLMEGMRVTLVEIMLGLALTVVVSIPLAVVIVYSRVLRNVLYPLLVGSQAIPRVAIAPLMLLWFGFGTLPKVLLAFSIAFFPLVINTVVGLQSVERDTMYLIRSMGASPLQTFIKVRFPAALPSIFGGLKVAVALAVIGVIVGEFVGSQSGLGYLVLVGQGTLNTRLIFASITIMALLGIVLFYIVEIIERISIHWYHAARAVAQERGGPEE